MTERTEAEQSWLRVQGYLSRHRHQLSLRAGSGYPPAARLAGTTLIAPPAWRLPAPVPLERLRLTFSPDEPAPDAPDVASLAPYALPERADGRREQRYSEVIARLARPAVFENRPVYRLVRADLADSAQPRLAFGRGRFFDSIDADGPAGHEFAAAALGELPPLPGGARPLSGTLPLRAALGGPAGLDRRVTTLAVSALTLRYDRTAGTATFPLHHRGAGRVSHAGGLYQVLPVGVFQPAGEAPWNEENDFDLWRGLLREYAEEFLGAGEDYGTEQAPLDYAAWPLAAAMDGALADGRIRAWCLGLGADPLTFAVDLLAVVVIDAPLYDELFSGLVDVNAEGEVTGPCDFDQPTVRRLLADKPLQAAAEALLTLALAHRPALLGR